MDTLRVDIDKGRRGLARTTALQIIINVPGPPGTTASVAPSAHR